MNTLRLYVTTPGRPASISPWSRTRAAVAHNTASSSPRAPSRTVASSRSSDLPSAARARARRIALVLIGRPYGRPFELLVREGVFHGGVGRAGPVAGDDRHLLRLLEAHIRGLRAAQAGRAAGRELRVVGVLEEQVPVALETGELDADRARGGDLDRLLVEAAGHVLRADGVALHPVVARVGRRGGHVVRLGDRLLLRLRHRGRRRDGGHDEGAGDEGCGALHDGFFDAVALDPAGDLH